MEWVLIILGLLIAAGAAIAIYERRTQSILLAHDLNLKKPQTEADREAERAAQAIREAHQRSMMNKP